MASYQHSLVVAARKQSTHTHTHSVQTDPDRTNSFPIWEEMGRHHHHGWKWRNGLP